MTHFSISDYCGSRWQLGEMREEKRNEVKRASIESADMAGNASTLTLKLAVQRVGKICLMIQVRQRKQRYKDIIIGSSKKNTLYLHFN